MTTQSSNHLAPYPSTTLFAAPPERPGTGPTTHPIGVEADLLSCRHAVRSAALAVGLGLIEQTKLVTAASELVRNAYVHGGGGSLTIHQITRPDGRRGLQLVIRDEGPGIADVEQATTDGFTTGGGLGLGLGGSRRLVDDFTIETAPGRGTTVTVVRWAT
jgi:serine/threonine-protein kinase RsbT